MDFTPYVEECSRIWKVSFKSLRIIYKPKTNNGYGIIGLCKPFQGNIRIMPSPVYPLEIIIHILTHELAHYVDWYRNGGKWRTRKGRTQFHDETFRSILQELADVHPTWTQDLTKRGLVRQ